MDPDLLKEVSESVVSLAGLAVVTGVSIGGAWLRQHLNIANEANASATDLNANSVIQSAVHNAAGAIVLDIASGKLDITKPSGIAQAALAAAKSVAYKVPDAIARFELGNSDLAEMIVGKVGHSVGVPTTPNTATDAKQENSVPLGGPPANLISVVGNLDSLLPAQVTSTSAEAG